MHDTTHGLTKQASVVMKNEVHCSNMIGIGIKMSGIRHQAGCHHMSDHNLQPYWYMY